MRLTMILVVLSMLLVSCSGTVYITPAEPKIIKKVFEFNLSYDKAWLYSVDWFAESNITIDLIQKESGLLSAKYNVKLHPDALDCGNVEASTLATIHRYDEIAKINMTIREVDEKRTKITINISGSYEGEGRDNGWGKILLFSGQCYSTGFFEQSVASFISARI